MQLTLGNDINICVFGEVLWDIIDGSAHLGGAPFNFAAHAARLGINAHLVSRVGNDALGSDALKRAAAMGVALACVGVDPHYPTGVVNVILSESGQPHYEISYPGAWDFIDFEATVSRQLLPERIDAIYFGTLAQRSDVSRSALRSLLDACSGVPIVYDINLRQSFYTSEIIEWGLRRATVVKMNEDECRHLCEVLLKTDASGSGGAQELRRTYGIDVLLVTLGAAGCRVLTDNEALQVPGHKVNVVDTVGAGDAFCSAFLAAWLGGAPLFQAATLGNAVGAYVASQSGAVPEYSPSIASMIESISLKTGKLPGSQLTRSKLSGNTQPTQMSRTIGSANG